MHAWTNLLYGEIYYSCSYYSYSYSHAYLFGVLTGVCSQSLKEPTKKTSFPPPSHWKMWCTQLAIEPASQTTYSNYLKTNVAVHPNQVVGAVKHTRLKEDRQQ